MFSIHSVFIHSSLFQIMLYCNVVCLPILDTYTGRMPLFVFIEFITEFPALILKFVNDLL